MPNKLKRCNETGENDNSTTFSSVDFTLVLLLLVRHIAEPSVSPVAQFPISHGSYRPVRISLLLTAMQYLKIQLPPRSALRQCFPVMLAIAGILFDLIVSFLSLAKGYCAPTGVYSCNSGLEMNGECVEIRAHTQ
jgi:hypothetical protein